MFAYGGAWNGFHCPRLTDENRNKLNHYLGQFSFEP
jgi:hypothetical protein